MADQDERGSQLVVIGSSAGGIDALTTLVGTLPKEMPAPILIAQHLDPHRASHLTEILQRASPLHVETVEDEAALAPNTIFVLPPGSHAEITDHVIRLSPTGDQGPRPSIDLLFTSAAQVFGEGLIAVILTGTGHDGAAGARDVKGLGGTVIVQNPDTASYPGMPLALAPTSIDIVAELGAIGPLLYELLTAPVEPSRPDEERLLTTFLEQLRERSGIDFASYKRATILRRLQRRMIATSSPKLRDYIRYALANPEEYQRLTATFLIKVTEFFRDADLFDQLRDVILPELIDEARKSDRELRIWSAGCATGEEAYSLAILVADALGEEIDAFNVRIFATDVDGDAIAFARRGIYPEAALAHLAPDLVARHFTNVGDGFEVRPSIRAMTVFGQHDLGQRAPFPRVDLALCRNVLIYFTSPLQKRALQLFAFSIRDGGYLVLGKAESTTPLAESWVLAHPRLKIYRRQGMRVLVAPAGVRGGPPLVPAAPMSPRRGSWIDATLAKARTLSRGPTGIDRAESLMLRLPVGIVVVDRDYDIVSVNGTARNLLGIHGAGIGSDLVHLVPAGAAEILRVAIDRAFDGEIGHGTVAVATAATAGTDVRSVQLAAHPFPATDAATIESVVVIVTDVTLDAARLRELEEALEKERADREAIIERGRQVAVSHAQLLEANTELTSTNAELRSANQELLVANEEVQAATEEVETLNEELQATNEELETLNEELQATVEELSTTNEDLHARNLDALGSDLRDPRTRAILAAVRRLLDDPAPLAMIGPAAHLDITNAAFQAFIAGTSFSDHRDRPVAPADEPVARARRGERFEMIVTARRGRRTLGRYSIRSTPVSRTPDAPMLLEVRSLE
jgi:two-component system CheB/CheR fusion protein